MERESFEDQEVADLLNEYYISIKVDREERPDVDTIYMSVCQAMTGHGGWPLTMIMTPDKKPFFAGTYYPKNSRMGMPGVIDILTQITDLWQHRKAELVESSEKVTNSIAQSLFAHSEGDVSEQALHDAYKYYAGNFDPQDGGFGPAPKFPAPHNLSFLLRYWKMTGTDHALAMVEKTLEAMYRGGIYDHVGFGFSRYSTDEKWLVPHFEKMLYDNSLLAIAYLETYQATRNELFAKVAKEIFTYVLRDMTSEEGAFYSAEDADSEGVEGKFYVWSPAEVIEVLGEDAGKQFCQQYDITAKGNFEGQSIANLIHAETLGGFETAGNQLFLHRENRIHPFKDDKILTSWNGLMIAAMSIGSRVLGEKILVAAAERALDFVLTKLRRDDGRLLARYRDGEAAIPAFVDDYAFLIWGLIELYQATFKPQYLSLALELNEGMLELFWDENKGGLFQYGSDAEQLISRPKDLYDGAIPSGNSVATVNFLRLSALTGDLQLMDKFEEQLETFGGSVSQVPMGHSHFLMAVYLNHVNLSEVTLVGDLSAKDTLALLAKINSNFLPEVVTMAKDIRKNAEDLEKLIPALQNRELIEGKATAYVCKDFSCRPPITDTEQLAKILEQ